MKKRTKILATVGPASDSLENLEGLVRAGVDVFRLNFSHGTHEYHKSVLDRIRKIEEKLCKKIGILQDICGPKIRIGKLKEDFELKSGDILEFSHEQIIGEKVDKKRYILSINHPEILDLLKEDEYIYLYDGQIKAKVVEIGSFVRAKVENKGILSSNKGVNFPNTSLNINIITEKDKADMQWGAKNGVDFVAISFVQNAEDIIQAREILKSFNSSAWVFAKIEKFDAVENIDEILEVSDGLMVARGDLGIEVPYYKVPSIQKNIIKKANAKSKPVITATQMLLSMAKNDTATRAEISDVANAVLDGTDAVMLSEESAVGKNPCRVVLTMANTIKETEKFYPFDKFSSFKFEDDTDIITHSSASLAHNLHAKAIIALSNSGASINKTARYRTEIPIYAITHSEKTARKLTIVWGVNPIMTIEEGELSPTLSKIVKKLLKREILSLKHTYIVTAGYPVGVSGSTNFIRILKREQIEFYRDYQKK